MDFSSFLPTIVYTSSYLISMFIYRMYKEQQFAVKDNKQERYRRKRLKIIILGFPTFLCTVHSYSQKVNILSWNNNIGMGILISLYMSFVLYVGPIYHEFWVFGCNYKEWQIKKETRETYIQQIQMGLLYQNSSGILNYNQIPIIEELSFRGFAKNSLNSEFQNNNIYLIYSTLLYLIVRLILFIPKHTKHGYFGEALKSLLLGIYLSYVLIQTETVAAAIINHGCINFMGSPNIQDLLRGDYSHELRFKILRFYCLGFFAFLIFCLIVL